LLFGAPSVAASDYSLAEVREQQALQRSAFLRANGGFIPESGFKQRKAFFATKVARLLSSKDTEGLTGSSRSLASNSLAQ
jgi:hypothetical protein